MTKCSHRLLHRGPRSDQVINNNDAPPLCQRSINTKGNISGEVVPLRAHFHGAAEVDCTGHRIKTTLVDNAACVPKQSRCVHRCSSLIQQDARAPGNRPENVTAAAPACRRSRWDWNQSDWPGAAGDQRQRCQGNRLSKQGFQRGAAMLFHLEYHALGNSIIGTNGKDLHAGQRHAPSRPVPIAPAGGADIRAGLLRWESAHQTAGGQDQISERGYDRDALYISGRTSRRHEHGSVMPEPSRVATPYPE